MRQGSAVGVSRQDGRDAYAVDDQRPVHRANVVASHGRHRLDDRCPVQERGSLVGIGEGGRWRHEGDQTASPDGVAGSPDVEPRRLAGGVVDQDEPAMRLGQRQERDDGHDGKAGDGERPWAPSLTSAAERRLECDKVIRLGHRSLHAATPVNRLRRSKTTGPRVIRKHTAARPPAASRSTVRAARQCADCRSDELGKTRTSGGRWAPIQALRLARRSPRPVREIFNRKVKVVKRPPKPENFN